MCTSVFCENNHIQGGTSGTYYIALKNKETDEIVAVSIWRKEKDILYLDRYCTSVNVIGGFGKLMKYVKGKILNYNNEKGIDRRIVKIVTFADHCVSNGSVYEKLGFTKDKCLEPEYSYYYNGKRRHKFGFRKKRFKNDPELLYKDNMTEKELADLNGIIRVYDYGKTRYVFYI